MLHRDDRTTVQLLEQIGFIGSVVKTSVVKYTQSVIALLALLSVHNVNVV